MGQYSRGFDILVRLYMSLCIPISTKYDWFTGNFLLSKYLHLFQRLWMFGFMRTKPVPQWYKKKKKVVFNGENVWEIYSLLFGYKYSVCLKLEKFNAAYCIIIVLYVKKKIKTENTKCHVRRCVAGAVRWGIGRRQSWKQKDDFYWDTLVPSGPSSWSTKLPTCQTQAQKVTSHSERHRFHDTTTWPSGGSIARRCFSNRHLRLPPVPQPLASLLARWQSTLRPGLCNLRAPATDLYNYRCVKCPLFIRLICV